MQIRLGPYSFSISTPYRAGQPLGEPEAQELNRRRAENIRKAIATFLPRPSEPLLAPEALEAVQERVRQLDDSYVFALRPLRDEASPGTIEAEAHALARDRVDSKLRQEQVAVSRTQYAEMVARVVGLDEVQAEARRRLAAQLGVASVALEDL